MAVPPRQVTLVDVARLARVSASTVSRALSGHQSVDPHTVRRVLAAAEQLGYVPNTTARAVVTGSMPTVAVILPDLGRSECAMFLRGVMECAEDRGLGVLVASCGGSDEQVSRTLRTIRGQRPRCVLVIDADPQPAGRSRIDSELAAHRAAGGRVLFLSRASATSSEQGRTALALGLSEPSRQVRDGGGAG